MNERSIFFLLFSDACRLNPLKGIYLERKKNHEKYSSFLPRTKRKKIRTAPNASRIVRQRCSRGIIMCDRDTRTRTRTERMSFEGNRKCLQAIQLAGVQSTEDITNHIIVLRIASRVENIRISFIAHNYQSPSNTHSPRRTCIFIMHSSNATHEYNQNEFDPIKTKTKHE